MVFLAHWRTFYTQAGVAITMKQDIVTCVSGCCIQANRCHCIERAECPLFHRISMDIYIRGRAHRIAASFIFSNCFAAHNMTMSATVATATGNIIYALISFIVNIFVFVLNACEEFFVWVL